MDQWVINQLSATGAQVFSVLFSVDLLHKED